MNTITADQAIDQLLELGYDRADILTAMDSLANADPSVMDGYTSDDLDVLCEQLSHWTVCAACGEDLGVGSGRWDSPDYDGPVCAACIS